MELISEPVIYGNEVVGLGHLVCINILAYADIHQNKSKAPHIVICKKEALAGMRYIIDILSPNICFVPFSEERYSRIVRRYNHRLYSFEYACKQSKITKNTGILYGESWNKALEYLGKGGISLYNSSYLDVPRLYELYPDIFEYGDRIAVINARTTPTDTYNRNSDPDILQPLIRLLKVRGYKVVRLGANFQKARLRGIDLDMSDKWSSGVELSALKSANIVVGSLTGITILSGMLRVPTVVYDCPTPIQTYLFHNFSNHYILFKKPSHDMYGKTDNIYDYYGTALHEYRMIGALGSSNSEDQVDLSLFKKLVPNTPNELCSAVDYALMTLEGKSLCLTEGLRRFKNTVYKYTGLRSSQNRLFPESIYTFPDSVRKDN
jgi:hypothetical protein